MSKLERLKDKIIDKIFFQKATWYIKIFIKIPYLCICLIILCIALFIDILKELPRYIKEKIIDFWEFFD